jgi:lipoyl(octanoyl) transferase
MFLPRALTVRRLGVIEYDEAAALQARCVEERRRQEIGDTLLLLQHPDVITLGVRVRNDWSHILADRAHLQAQGVSVRESGRGGDVTYHGPGQLVGYPILDLNPDRRDLHRYVRDLEGALILALASFDIHAGRIPGLTGVWVGNEKIAAIGVRLSRWITSHGFALNVSTDLERFRLIVPCGIADRGVTSMERVLGRSVQMEDVEVVTARAVAHVFGFQQCLGDCHEAIDTGVAR